MLISGNPSEALSMAMQIENDNNALISFQKQKSTLMNAFNDTSQENANQIPLIEETPVVEVNIPSYDTKTPMSDDEIESILDEEQKRAKLNQTEMFDDTIKTTE